jgi:RNA polymerase sigma-70 factor (ECF subfamily)
MKKSISRRLRPVDSLNPKRPPQNDPSLAGIARRQCRSKAGDRTVEDVALRMVEFLPRLRRFATSLTHDRTQSEDLVQETYARALAHLDRWRPDSRLDSWMYRIAQNLWIDQLRMEKSRGEVVDITAFEDLSGCDGRIVIESRLSLFELRKYIAQLPPSQRLLLRLVCEDGLSYREAAEALDSPTGTIMSRLARARLALHEAIARNAPAGRQ